MSLLLVYGTDRSLLRTRQWVLEQGGFDVWTACSSTEIEQILDAQPVALLILCHSLSLAECRPALTLADAISPPPKKLLFQGPLSKELGCRADTIFDSFEGPVAFIHAVRDLLGVPVKQCARTLVLINGGGRS